MYSEELRIDHTLRSVRPAVTSFKKRTDEKLVFPGQPERECFRNSSVRGRISKPPRGMLTPPPTYTPQIFKGTKSVGSTGRSVAEQQS